MSSLLAYGQGFLAEDIWSGAGLTEPWAQSFGWWGEDSSPACVEGGPDESQSLGEDGNGGGLSQFFKVIQAAAPPEALNSPKVLTRSSTKKELHWDSPPQSPSTVFVHLPYSVLSIISAGTKADAVVVGVFQNGSDSVVETLLYLPRGLNFAEYIHFKPDLLRCVNGKVWSMDKLDLPVEFSNSLKQQPEAFLGLRFSLEKYNGIIFGLWLDGSTVQTNTEAIFSDAMQSLPLLLSNRINVRKYERLGRRFDAILRVIPDAVLFVDDEMAQVVVNSAAATLLGLPNHGEVEPNKVAAAMRALTERCNTRTDPQHWMRLVSTDEEVEIEEDWELTMPRRVLHVRSYPVTSHAAHGRLWIYADVTAERDAEQAIEAANRAKSQFLAMMSHELRTPMTGVLGMLDLLHLTNLESEQQGLVKIMQESAEGLMEVINNILDYCKIEAGRLQLEEIDFSLPHMFRQIQSMVKMSFLKKELKLTISGEPSGRRVVRGDPVRLRQVLLNIISNAIKFTEDGSIDISWRFLDPQWVDTTVVAMSQSSSGKSKLINQIINASRGEKCSVEQIVTPTGRSGIVVNCSSAGAAGPYLESSISSSTCPLPAVPSPLAQRSQPAAGASLGNNPSELPTTSFPVLYSLALEKRAAEAFLNADTRHKFNDRKSLAGKRTPSSGDLASQFKRSGSDAEHTTPPFTEKALVKDPISGFEEKQFRANKYQKLFEEEPSPLQGTTSMPGKSLQPDGHNKELGVRKIPELCNAVPPASLQPGFTGVTGRAVESFVVRERITERRPHVCAGNVSSNQAEEKCDTSKEEPKMSGPTSGLKFCKICKVVLYEDEQEIKPEDKVWLEVTTSDTGVGMGKEQLDRLFVGSQAGSQRRNAAGTGLGLAICKGLLCLMNGKIQMESKIGEGTTVIMTIPLLPAADAVQELVESVLMDESTSMEVEPPSTTVVQPIAYPKASSSKPVVAAETKPAESSKPQIQVLVAEDNRVNQLLIRKMFQHIGHQVEIVGNGKLAVEAVQRTTFDLVLMDVQMPVLDGLSATKAIRALAPPTSFIPIYALSADSPGSGPLEETGLDGYLKKPIAWDTMTQLINQILAAKSES